MPRSERSTRGVKSDRFSEGISDGYLDAICVVDAHDQMDAEIQESARSVSLEAGYHPASHVFSETRNADTDALETVQVRIF